MIDFAQFKNQAAAFLHDNEHNHVQKEDALRPDLIGMQIFMEPLFGVASADDPLFGKLLQPEVIDPNYWLPQQWLDGAKTVLACFLPFNPQIKEANAADFSAPADEWLQGRIEGQEMVAIFGSYLRDQLIAAGYETVLPCTDSRFKMLEPFKSNWSERHTAYICGLGTFGMSKGLITEKGIAGRICSVITTAELPVTQRPYSGLYDYCTRCGKCAQNCPVGAIDVNADINAAKKHQPCDHFVTSTRALKPNQPNHKAYFGCGKCQVAVPCANGIPQGAKVQCNAR